MVPSVIQESRADSYFAEVPLAFPFRQLYPGSLTLPLVRTVSTYMALYLWLPLTRLTENCLNRFLSQIHSSMMLCGQISTSLPIACQTGTFLFIEPYLVDAAPLRRCLFLWATRFPLRGGCSAQTYPLPFTFLPRFSSSSKA